MTPEPQPRASSQPGWGVGGPSVVHVPHGSHCGGQATGQAFADLPVILGFDLQEGHDILKGTGRLQAEGIHHVDQVVCTDGEQTHTAQQTEHQVGRRQTSTLNPPKCQVSTLPRAARPFYSERFSKRIKPTVSLGAPRGPN